MAKSPNTRAQQPASNTARSGAQDTKSTIRRAAKNKVTEVASQAETLAEDAVSVAKAKADDVVQAGKDRTENVVRSLSRAMAAGSDSLAQDGMIGTAGYVRAAADGLTYAADEVDGFQAPLLTQRVEDFVRERPMLTVGALALAGFAFASAMKPPRRS